MEKKKVADNKLRVAYFCMEFGLHEDFRIYSGGLGILAGDVLKAAKDEGLPMVGVGILWRQGYTNQYFDDSGKPYDCFHEYSYDFLEDTGVTVNVLVRGRQIRLKVWKCTKYDNAALYLLDANLPQNKDRLITGQLYGWFNEERIAQEMILGIGGIKALRKLGLKMDIYHFNDSHPVFAGTELIREAMEDEGLEFNEALCKVRQTIVFTTHTPVEAGNEVHEHEVLRYMGAYNTLTYGQMVKLGGEPFSMTVAGLKLSKKANGVSELHGEIARDMWKEVAGGAEIIAVTNGVHNGTWQDGRIRLAYEVKSGVWHAHSEAKREMIKEIFSLNGVLLKEDVLTIGFARRIAPYKRGDLIFSNPELIEPLLKDGKVQMVFSGKTHPNDLDGKIIAAKLYGMSKKYPESVVFVQNYDMHVGKLLTRGCDVWLNNPIRPMEASGTSGMKAAMNGVLNLSILDGWWPEGCIHKTNGWQIGDGHVGNNCDEVDAAALYKVLLEEVVPTYYKNRSKWEDMMYESIAMSIKRFSASRMLNDYYNLVY